MQFLIKAYDGKGMLDKRMEVRPRHLEGMSKLNEHVSLDKRSKKQQKEFHSKQRRTWGELNPVTRSVPNGKAYNRKKEKERVSKEFRDGFGADFFVLTV